MKMLVVGDSPDFEIATVAAVAASCTAVVALDGAAEKLPAGVNPILVCGDFDSLDVSQARRRFPAAEFVELADQNENDLEKALRLLVSRGAREVVLCSVLGGRPDQNLANLGVMVRHHTVLSLCAIHGGFECRVASLGHPLRLALKEGDELSVVPFGVEATISLNGVRWPLAGEVLRGGSHGVSNVALGGEVLVSPESGTVFVFSPQRLHPVESHDS